MLISMLHFKYSVSEKRKFPQPCALRPNGKTLVAAKRLIHKFSSPFREETVTGIQLLDKTEQSNISLVGIKEVSLLNSLRTSFSNTAELLHIQHRQDFQLFSDIFLFSLHEIFEQDMAWEPNSDPGILQLPSPLIMEAAAHRNCRCPHTIRQATETKMETACRKLQHFWTTSLC